MSYLPPWLRPFQPQDDPFNAPFGSTEALNANAAWRGQGIKPGNVRLNAGTGGLEQGAFGTSFTRPGTSTTSFLNANATGGIGRGMPNFGQDANRGSMTGEFLNYGYPGNRFITDPNAAKTPLDIMAQQSMKAIEESGSPFWAPGVRGTINNRYSPGLTGAGTSVSNRLGNPTGWAQNKWNQLILESVSKAEQMTGVFVPPNVMKAVMRIESPSGDPYADNVGDAVGLMQLTHSANTGNFAFDWNRARTDVTYNGLMGAVALAETYKQMKTMYGEINWTDVAAGYFAGVYGAGHGAGPDVLGTSVPAYRARFEDYMQQLGETPNVDPRFANANINNIWGGTNFNISQGFGLTDFAQGNSDYAYSTGYTKGGSFGGHIGIDVSMPENTAIYAPVGGVIRTDGAAFADDGGGIGRISLILPNGDEIIFGHMRSLNDRLQNGITINAGTFIGRSGTAGTGPHLHLEVRAKQQECTTPTCYIAIDPRNYFTGNIGQAMTPGEAQSAAGIDPTANLIPGLPSARGLTSPWGRGSYSNPWSGPGAPTVFDPWGIGKQ